jgi:hypothetical protein
MKTVYGSAKEWHTIDLASRDLRAMAEDAYIFGDDTLATMFETAAMVLDDLWVKTSHEQSTGGRTANQEGDGD